MKLNQAGIALIKHYESCRLKAYQDDGGVWTIGWGHTSRDVKSDSVITQEQADALFDKDIAQTCKYLDNMLAVELNNNQFSALVSLVYNCGIGHVERSTLWQKLQAGQLLPAAEEFTKWTRVNGSVDPGLPARRLAEKKLFETPDSLS